MINNTKDYTLNFLKNYYAKNNPFYNYLGINLEKAYLGHVLQNMEVVANRHTNIYGYIQGGVVMSLGDIGMALACASLTKRVVTVDAKTNFIKNVKAPGIVKMKAKVIHNGKRTMVAEAKLYDFDDEILSTMQATFYVIGVFEELLNVQID